ncbi:MAG: Crp/Fnr family transcriptional regulator [Xanthomonadales bacterium]|nr:Crp/Fnr family transcriptional regulator [Xanthomonadales bacterium]
MSDPISHLVGPFGLYSNLDEREKNILNAIREKDVDVAAGECFQHRGQPLDYLFFLASGWAANLRLLEEGKTQLVDIKLPGAICGLEEISFKRALTDWTALTDCQFYRFPKSRIRDLFNESPKLAAISLFLCSHERGLLVERVTEAGRRDARAAIASFLVGLATRLEKMQDTRQGFLFPLKHRHIADAVAMTPVHVSRTLTQLKADGIVEISDGWARILDREALIALADREKNFFEPDLSWI